MNPLVSKPAKTDDPRGLGYSDAMTGTIMALYGPTLWTHLKDGLTELKRPRRRLLTLADAYMNRDDKGHYTNSTDALIAINCVDEPPITGPGGDHRAGPQLREVAPFMSYGGSPGTPAEHLRILAGAADQHPHTVSAPGVAPILVVSTARSGHPSRPVSTW